MPKRRAGQGFTLIELMLVVLIIGLMASILMPALIDALQKARQKRTITDIKGIGLAWMSWLTDQQSAASAGSSKVIDTSTFSTVNYPQLFTYLHPTSSFFYAQEVPQTDGWGGELDFRHRLDDDGDVQSVFVCSSASNGGFEACSLDDIPISSFLSTDYKQDIVWVDGFFIRWPSGVRPD